MRVPIMAGNWKMNKTPSEAVEFVTALKEQINGVSGVERVLCPPYMALPALQEVLADTDISLGAQDVHHEEDGAFTSSISASMLEGYVEYVIIGHSETRQYLGVTDESVNKKVKIALQHGLKPIVAMGESFAQNEAGATETVCDSQIRAALYGIEADQMADIVIAYEPIWAIGTGKTATPEQAQAIIGGVIRQTLRDLYNDAVADATRILYGGSMKPANCRELMEQPDIDGGLIGGASLKVDAFTELVKITLDVTSS